MSASKIHHWFSPGTGIIVDPQFPNKLQSGRRDEIAPLYALLPFRVLIGLSFFSLIRLVIASSVVFYLPNTNWKSTSISGIVTMHSAMLSTL